MQYLLIANPENRRAAYFAEACARMGFPPPRLVPWIEALEEDTPLEREFERVDRIRIESPGENFPVERRLLELGFPACNAEECYPCLSPDDASIMTQIHGRVYFHRQWQHGWLAALERIRGAASASGVPFVNHPDEIGVLFDKHATRERLGPAGVPIPMGLGICEGFEDLAARMDGAGWNRVFLKPCHGSSASGVAAIERNRRGQWRAVTSAVLTESPGCIALRNSLKLRQLDNPRQITALVNAICRERAIAERWFPKAGIDGRVFDLRVVVIRGRAAHIVVRTSLSPITNLHLGNSRGDPERVRLKLGTAVWDEALRHCEEAAACFPRCGCTAVDLMISTNHRHCAVAEVNAFGDLIPNVTWRQMNTYEAVLEAFISRG